MQSALTQSRFFWGPAPIVLVLLLAVAPAQGLAQPVLADLQARARELQLAEHPYWLKLLHFYRPGESVGQWSSGSDVVSPEFFLAPKGRTDPQAELDATLAGFLEPAGGDPDNHPRCRLTARYHWLREHLPLPELQPGSCPRFERWSNLPAAKGISLVFVSAFLDNPASLYGHLLIKFNTAAPHYGHSLLSPTLNFGAVSGPEDSAVEFAVRGIFGGYHGVFSDERFYSFNHVYGERELRDLWEYPIRFTPKQRERIARHAWELLQDVRFTYYFFLDNCAYRQAELLELAWTDATRINTPRALWAIPVDVVFKMQSRRAEDGKSLLGEPTLIPSRQRRLMRHSAGLNPERAEWLRRLAKGESDPEAVDFQRLPEESQARVLDALIDYQQYVRNGALAPEQQALRTRVLRRRSQLPILPEPTDPTPPKPPTGGTPPTRFRTGAVANADLGPALELGAWVTYHDLLGDATGHLPDAGLVTLDLRLHVRQDNVTVSQFEVARVEKLALPMPGIPEGAGWSWRVRLGWERRHLACARCRVFRLAGGLGKAAAPVPGFQAYALLEAFTEAGHAAWSATTLGLAPHLGLRWMPVTAWQLQLEGGRFHGLSGPKVRRLRVRLDQRLTLSSRSDLRLELEEREGREGRLALNWYW